VSVNTVPFADLVFAVLAIACAATLWAVVYAAGRLAKPRPLPPLPPEEYRALYADLDAFERGQRP
jgi:hypothetical protein